MPNCFIYLQNKTEGSHISLQENRTTGWQLKGRYVCKRNERRVGNAVTRGILKTLKFPGGQASDVPSPLVESLAVAQTQSLIVKVLPQGQIRRSTASSSHIPGEDPSWSLGGQVEGEDVHVTGHGDGNPAGALWTPAGLLAPNKRYHRNFGHLGMHLSGGAGRTVSRQHSWKEMDAKTMLAIFYNFKSNKRTPLSLPSKK